MTRRGIFPLGAIGPSSGDFSQRVFLELLNAFARLIDLHEVARQFEFTSLHQPVSRLSDIPEN
jgi:hypothetical protein